MTTYRISKRRCSRLAVAVVTATCIMCGAKPGAGGESRDAAASTKATDAETKKKAAQPKKKDLGAPIRDEQHMFRCYVKSWTARRTENVVMQQRDYSCGAAALATLIRYHWGDDVTELQVLEKVFSALTVDELRDRIQNGLTMTDLRKLAVELGYLSVIGKLEFNKLRESKVPLVVGLIVNEYEHFVVYRGTDDQYVYLADPTRGNLRTPIPEFIKQWQKNAVLVVVKRGVPPEKTSALSVGWNDTFLGELNRLHLRDRLTTQPLPP